MRHVDNSRGIAVWTECDRCHVTDLTEGSRITTPMHTLVDGHHSCGPCLLSGDLLGLGDGLATHVVGDDRSIRPMITITCSDDQSGHRHVDGCMGVAAVASVVAAVSWIKQDICDRKHRHIGDPGSGNYVIHMPDGRAYTWCAESGGDLVERYGDDFALIERVSAAEVKH